MSKFILGKLVIMRKVFGQEYIRIRGVRIRDFSCENNTVIDHISFSSLFVFQTFTTFILFHEPYSERMIGHGYRTDIIAKIVIFLYIILHLLI